ncbi:MAG TPA: hypothetical protein VJP85_03295 [Candidatus Baltobacteraceae bacterium]|nr:hypothetical protein [Candidatus Baltobacteraceae bacterium]
MRTQSEAVRFTRNELQRTREQIGICLEQFFHELLDVGDIWSPV